jgi:superfamily II DNA/RNA helicase
VTHARPYSSTSSSSGSSGNGSQRPQRRRRPTGSGSSGGGNTGQQTRAQRVAKETEDYLASLEHAPTPEADAAVPTWIELGVPQKLAESLQRKGFAAPFPIQAGTFVDATAGRDLLGRGRTGSGKTLAFGLPLITRLAAENRRPQPHRPRSLVLVPTRELAAQVDAALAPLGQILGLRTRTVVGGVGFFKQKDALQRGIDILVATPGRLTDLIQQGDCDLSETGIVVLDEADQMCDLGFLPVVRQLLGQCPDGQRMLFSATLDAQVAGLVRDNLSSPVVHAMSTGADNVVEMEHHVLAVSGDDKPNVILQLAGRQGRTLMFVRTKHGADRLAKQLTRDGVPSGALHGNLAQNARTRALAAFSDGSVPVLVATDVAARGLHVDDVDLVVHVDPPTEHKTYLHRSGRTARAGAAGRVITLALPDQARDVASLLRMASVEVEPVRTASGDAHLLALRGEAAEHVEYVAPRPSQQQRPRQSGGGSRGNASYAPKSGGGGRPQGSGRGQGSGSGRAQGSGRPSSGGSRPMHTSSSFSASTGKPSRGQGNGR